MEVSAEMEIAARGWHFTAKLFGKVLRKEKS